jgi:hypothetical protein
MELTTVRLGVHTLLAQKELEQQRHKQDGRCRGVEIDATRANELEHFAVSEAESAQKEQNSMTRQ